MANTKVTSSLIADNAIGIDQLNVSDGTNGQALVTDGAGTLSFSTIQGYTDSDVETYLNTSEIYTDPTNNYLGIGSGASTPSHVFHVQKSVASGTLVKLQNASNTASDVLLLNTAGTGSGTNILDVQAAGSSKFLVRGDGNVGIGVDNPSDKLHIQGTDASTTDTLGLRITNFSTTTNSIAGVIFQNYDNHSAYIRSPRSGSTAGILTFGTNAATGTAESNIQERMRITSSGYVGIGTDNPSSMLHLSAGVTGVSGGEAANLTLTNKFDTPDNSWTLKPQRTGVSNTGLEIRDVTDSRSDMSFDGTGKVGIAQASPSETLHIGSGQSNYIRIHNAASGDVASGIQITRGTGLGLQIYDNPFDGTSTFSAAGNVNFRTDSTSYRVYIKQNGAVAVGGNATAGKSFEVQDRQSGYSSFWIDDNNRDYGRGTTNAMGLLGGTSTQYDGDGGAYPIYGFGGAADNAAGESVDFWIRSTTSEWQPMVFFCIGAGTNTAQTGQTAGWALIRATHYFNGVSTAILDSGGGGTFSLSVVSGSLDLNDVMQVRITYSGGQNRACLSVWCNTYQQIRGAQRS